MERDGTGAVLMRPRMTERVQDTLRALDAVTVGDYACFAGGLAAAGDPRPAVPWQRLLDAEMQADIDARFHKRFGVFEPRAVRSIWMKWYLNVVVPPLLLADVFLMRALPVALDDIEFVISDDARIAAIKLLGAARDSSHSDPFARFETLIFGHFEPLIDHLSVRSDITQRVYWSNVGNTFEAMLRRIELVSGRSVRLDETQRLIDEPNWPDGRANPLYDAVHYLRAREAPTRRRRVCCLQYLLPDRRFCSACPIEEAHLPRAAS